MPVEIIKEPYRRSMRLRIPEHWHEFLEQEAKEYGKRKGCKHTTEAVILYAIKRLAYQRGFVQVGSNRGGVVVPINEEDWTEDE